MLTSIEFDDKFSARCTKIHNVISDGMLFSEMDFAHSVGAELCPQFFFGRGEVAI